MDQHADLGLLDLISSFMEDLKSILNLLSRVTWYDLIIFTFPQGTCGRYFALAFIWTLALCWSVHWFLRMIVTTTSGGWSGSATTRGTSCSSGYIVTVLYDLPHINTCKLNEESYSIFPIWIVFTIEIWRTIDRVSFSNVIDLVCHLLDLCPLQPLRSLTLEVGSDTVG